MPVLRLARSLHNLRAKAHGNQDQRPAKMASIPQETVEASNRDRARRSSSEQREKVKVLLSHGRGGAGNVGPTTTSDLDPISLTTPILKGEVFTTGRGGSGNMAKNTDPEAARRAQDLIAHPRRESTSSTHVGRGGAANVFHPTKDEIDKAKAKNAKNWENALADEEDAISHPNSSNGSAGSGSKPTSSNGSVAKGETKKERGESERRREMGFADKGKEWLGGFFAGAGHK